MVDVTVIPLWLDGSELSLSFFGIEVMAPMHKYSGMCPVELMPRKRLRRSVSVRTGAMFRFSAFNPAVSAVLFRLSFLCPWITWFSMMLLLHGAMHPLLLTHSLIVHMSKSPGQSKVSCLVVQVHCNAE